MHSCASPSLASTDPQNRSVDGSNTSTKAEQYAFWHIAWCSFSSLLLPVQLAAIMPTTSDTSTNELPIACEQHTEKKGAEGSCASAKAGRRAFRDIA